jgi:glycosyltransferase involved in cell wall biosynthesis
MHILYIHQYFVTPDGTTGTRSYDVSKYFLEMGHHVTVITGWHEQSGLASLPWYRLFRTQWVDGIQVVVCNVSYSNKMRVPARLWSFIGFVLLGTLACLRQRGVDIIFGTSTPLTVGVPSRVAGAIKRVPYVFEVRDLWPEDLLAAGRIKPGVQYRVWEWLERFSYKKAKRILLVSRGFHDRLLERGFAPQRLETVLLGADGALFRDLHPDHAFFRERGLDGKTIAIYTGAHGDANGLFQVLDAAEHLRDRDDIAVILMGDGKMKPAIQEAVRDRDLTNVHLFEPVPKHRLPDILSACHVGLMILKQITRPRWVTPNKVFDYMFSGLPSIVNFPGTTAQLVEADGTGVASRPGDAADLAAKIRHWADHPDERAAIGRRAREIAFDKYDRRMVAKRLAEIFQEVLDESRKP